MRLAPTEPRPIYIHHVPGRLRIRCATLKKNPTLSAAVKTVLEAERGVTQVEVEPLTGSLKIVYHPVLTDMDSIKSCLRNYSLAFDLPPASTGKPVAGSDRDTQDNASAFISQMAVMVFQTALKESVVLLMAHLL